MYFIFLGAAAYRYFVFISDHNLDFRKLLFSCTWFLSLRHVLLLPHSCRSCEIEQSMLSETEIGVFFLESNTDVFYKYRVQFDLVALSSGCSAKVYLKCHCSMYSLHCFTKYFQDPWSYTVLYSEAEVAYLWGYRLACVVVEVKLTSIESFSKVIWWKCVKIRDGGDFSSMILTYVASLEF